MLHLHKVISSQEIRHNWRVIRQRSTAKHLLAVLKSDAYGHGLLPLADVLADEADGIAVVSINDAQALRDAGYRHRLVLLEGLFDDAETPRVADLQLSPVVHTQWHLQALAALPAAARLTVFLKVNTGMNRLGFQPEDTAAALAQLRQTAAVKDIILMTHFACADKPNGTAAALAQFAPLRASLRLPVSLGNSAASLFADNMDDDWARIGIALYGSSPAPEWHTARQLGLSPVMSLRSRLISIRQLRRGEQIGYGGEFTATADMRIGIADVGYGDGYPRRYALPACVNDVVVPSVGRVSMQMTAFDLSACPAATVGDEITLWGEIPHVDDVAAAAGTISYDLLTAVARLPAVIT